MQSTKDNLQEIYHHGKTFFLYQREDVFSLTTDSVFLVDFVSIRKNDHVILDIGSGIGTIPILFATKTEKKIVGMEIQKEIGELSRKSIRYNHLENQISILIDDVQNFRKYFECHSVDVVISNPPYFKVDEKSLLNKNDQLTIARHEVKLSFEALALSVSQLLKENGRFFFIHQTDRLMEILETLKKYSLEPKKIQFLYPSKNKGSTLFLLEASYKGKCGLKVLEPKMIGEK